MSFLLCRVVSAGPEYPGAALWGSSLRAPGGQGASCCVARGVFLCVAVSCRGSAVWRVCTSAAGEVPVGVARVYERRVPLRLRGLFPAGQPPPLQMRWVFGVVRDLSPSPSGEGSSRVADLGHGSGSLSLPALCFSCKRCGHAADLALMWPFTAGGTDALRWSRESPRRPRAEPGAGAAVCTCLVCSVSDALSAPSLPHDGVRALYSEGSRESGREPWPPQIPEPLPVLPEARWLLGLSFPFHSTDTAVVLRQWVIVRPGQGPGSESPGLWLIQTVYHGSCGG